MSSPRWTSRTSMKCRSCYTARASTTPIVNHLNLADARTDLSGMGTRAGARQNPDGYRADRNCRQVRGVRRFLQEPQRSPVSRRHWQTSQGHAQVGRIRGTARRDARTSSFAPMTRILVPGGFGKRGIDGMLRAIRYARTRQGPVLWDLPGHGMRRDRICAQRLRTSGRQFRVRSVGAAPGVLHAAGTAGQRHHGRQHATGRLSVRAGSRFAGIQHVRAGEISERHRHRYEFNREYEKILISYGMRFSGNSPDRNFVEIVELPDHPWFLGCQFHPEFKSKPLQPHPLFASFIAAALIQAEPQPSAGKRRVAVPRTASRARLQGAIPLALTLHRMPDFQGTAS